MVGEERGRQAPRPTLTPPLSLDKGLAAEHRPPNLFQRVISLFRNVRPGSDLTNFQLPPLFNMPKSQLQCYGESVYCISEDILTKCARGTNSLERFVTVVAWAISTTRPVIFGWAPFNPVLGETHHVSKGTLNVLLEQVSHHPPVSALHATDEEENVELIWYHFPVPKFHGKSIKASVNGKRYLRLLSHGESYEMNSPDLYFNLLPVPGADWAGTVSIVCKESGLEAELIFYKGNSFLGFGGNSRLIKGKVFYSKSSKIIYEIDGQWDRIIFLKDVQNEKTSVLYDAGQTILNLNTPIVKDPEGVKPTESTVIWGEVSKHILQGDWEKAREEKREVEERERRLRIDRSYKGEIWVPKHFKVSQNKDGQWECWPLDHSVPPSPIIVPP
ncbi:oxysterol-binding protein-related protein 4C [Phalaenopsis equestris]|uniref:oxysterol-binding protein-related protein 4C n=1 Tax=Phalaenopsis equestris TaxID=78828 RepID=UPI0009E37CEB|nr:oxysterol-binding protein-related protein 4C [Phalaenopsis equestris]